MKKRYLVETGHSREFWTVEMIDGGYQPETVDRTPENADWAIPVVCIFRSLESGESYDAENCDIVEDDSSWDMVALTEDELAHLFDGVYIVNEKNFE